MNIANKDYLALPWRVAEIVSSAMKIAHANIAMTRLERNEVPRNEKANYNPEPALPDIRVKQCRLQC
jgi:hypothetical protein